MSLTTSYLTSIKNLDSIINSVINAKAPDKFTTRFLEDLGFKSSNDRLIIGVFKALGLIDDNGQPLQRYYEFLDQTQTKKILAIGIQEAYEDLFNLRKDAQTLSNDEIKNKLKTLTQGQKSEKVISLMAATFRALCDLADWTDIPIEKPDFTVGDTSAMIPTQQEVDQIAVMSGGSTKMNLHYNIQIHLPETTNFYIFTETFTSVSIYEGFCFIYSLLSVNLTIGRCNYIEKVQGINIA